MSERSSGRKANRRELAVGVFGCLLSAFVLREGVSQGLGTIRYPGAGFLPFLAAAILGVLALVTIVRSSLGHDGHGTIGDLWRGAKWGRVVVAVVSLIVYAAVLSPLGYLLATLGLSVVLFGLMGKPGLLVQLVSGLLTSVLTYLVFYTWLGVQLPRGILGLW